MKKKKLHYDRLSPSCNLGLLLEYGPTQTFPLEGFVNAKASSSNAKLIIIYIE